MKLYLHDSLTLLQQTSSNLVSMVFTDPPYFMKYRTRYRGSKEKGWGAFGIFKEYPGDEDTVENKLHIIAILQECRRVMKDNSAIYLFSGEESLAFYLSIMNALFTYRNLIVWKKNNWTGGDLRNAFGRQAEFIIFANKGKTPIIGKRYSNVWEVNRISSRKLLHPQQKPIELIEKAILASSNIGDIVLDPFMGSGSTGEACINTARDFIGIDIDKGCVETAAKRLHTGYYTDNHTFIIPLGNYCQVSSF